MLLIFITIDTFAKENDKQRTYLLENYGKIPLSFTANSGQFDSQVKFVTQGNGCKMFFTEKGTTFLLNGNDESFALKLHFTNANSNTEIVGEEMLAWNTNYLIGNNPNKWKTDVSNYSKVRLKNLYNGIDLVYYGNKNRIKYDFVVKSEADPEKILLKYDFGDISQYEGFDNIEELLSVNENGELVVRTPLGNITE